MKHTNTRSYDNALLKKERGIKIANIILFVIFLLYFIPVLYRARETGDPSGAWFPLFLFCALAQINSNHLKHIASIKLYRKENEKSQQMSAHYSKPLDASRKV